MVNFMHQRDGATGYPDIWSNILLECLFMAGQSLRPVCPAAPLDCSSLGHPHSLNHACNRSQEWGALICLYGRGPTQKLG